MKTFFTLLIVILLAIVVVIATHMNNVPKLDENVKASWSQVLNQYKRRADLIPNLVSTVKGYAKHEKEVFTEVTKARSSVGQMNISAESLNDPATLAAFEKNQSALSSALSRLLLVAERYPDLKADKNFLALQSQLEGTENRIAVARKDFIATIKAYNTELRTIPGKWVASILYPEATIKPTFTATQAEQANPQVSF